MVNNKKILAVEELLKYGEEYPIMAVINLDNLPTPQLQDMRAQLRDSVVLKATKKTLIKKLLAKLENKKENIQELDKYVKGIPALIFTKESPFKLYKILKKNKSFTFAKGGQTAPSDIIVKAGPTSFSPGPIIGELGSLGIKAGVDKGKIAIKEDKVVVKEGEVVSAKAATLLARLDVKPMEVGLDLTAAYEKGIIYDKSILNVDESTYIDAITNFHREAMNLSFNAGYYTKENIELFISESFNDARNLSINSNILTKDTIGNILAKANNQANAINNITNK